MIQGSLEALTSETDFVWVAFEDVEGKMTLQGEVFSAVFDAKAGIILPKDDIQCPMEVV